MFTHNPLAKPRHHRPRNVTLTNNLRRTIKQNVSCCAVKDDLSKPHHETAEQAASRALARIVASRSALAA